MRQEPDYYTVLQVDPGAEGEVSQAAYRRLAAKYHPDVAPSPGALERMKLLNAAYQVLSDPEKRKAYDLSRTTPRQRVASVSTATLRQQQPPRLLLVAAVLVAAVLVVVAALLVIVAFRPNPKLILIVGPLFLMLWLIWSRRA